jgi:2-desacetyl-2-hydroxyethyl bacteriochlorophyllide A dehydrogenase
MAPRKARSFWIVGRQKAELRDEELPDAGKGEVSVRTIYGAISRGTERLVWHGAVPRSEAERMRAPFQSGTFPWPVKYGYIAVGRVDDGPAKLRGRAVFCLHPHQDRFVVPADAVMPLPSGLPPRRAVLAANMETAINALWDAKPLAGERIGVIGAGVVGILVARLAAQIPGTSVELIDINGAKRRIASRLGIEFATPARAAGNADLVFHASGNPKGLETALKLAGAEARIVELSWYGQQRASLSLGEDFHARRLTLMSSQVGALPAAMLPRWDRKKRMELALALLKDPIFDLLLTGESGFSELPEAYGRVLSDKNALCHVIRYKKGSRE